MKSKDIVIWIMCKRFYTYYNKNIEKGEIVLFKKAKQKKRTAFMVAMLMLLSIVTPIDLSTVFAAENNDVVDIQVVATSDMHGRFLPYDYATDSEDKIGSMAQVSTMLKELRAQNPNTILVDNGDTIQDNSSALFLKDDIHPMVLAMNEMGYDSWNAGNHEFNYGVPTLQKVVSKLNGAFLCGNVFDKDGKSLGKPYTIVEKGGVKVGIIGMVTPHITKWDGPNLIGYTVTNPAEETRKVYDEIKDKVDVAIATVHVGENTEYGDGDSAREVAKAVPELAAVVAGHAHSTIKQVKEGQVVITEPYKGAGAISKIDIKLTKKDGKYVMADRDNDVKSDVIMVSTKGGKTYEADADLVSKLQPYHDRAVEDARVIIGELKDGDLVPASEIKGIPQSQMQDTAMIDLINKVQMFYGKADVASAAVFKDDANMKKGPISKAGTTSIYKFDNTLMTLKVNGEQLKRYMEWSAQYYNTFKPGDLTISFNQDVRNYNYDMFSGLKYKIDISKEVGKRIVDLTYMDGTPVKDTDTIKLAVNNYRANTTLLNEKSGLFKGENVEVLYDSFKEMGDDGRIRDLIRTYIVNEKGGVITPEVDNNWSLTGYKWDAAQREKAVKLINEGKLALPRSTDGRTPNVRSITLKDVLMVENTVIDILSFNDFHGSLKPEGKNIGAAKLAGEIKRLKGINPNTIVVAGGDLYQGSAMSNLKKGAPVSEMLKAIGLEASAVGNHEFDWGYELIGNWAKEGNFDFLASNLYETATGNPVTWAKPYKVIEKAGKKIGFIGIATPETAFKTKPENVAGFEFRDPLESANTWAKYLRETEKVDAVVALTHLGALQDSKTKEVTGEAADLAKTAKGIDAIISAHTHQYVNGVVNGIPVVQARNNGRSLADLSLVFDKDGKLSILNSVEDLYNRKDLVDDPAVKAIYDKYNKELQPILGELVATTDKDLTHDRFEGLSVLGQFTTKLMAEATGAQIGITNGGGLRKPLPKGDITVGDMYELMPFDNTLVTMNLKGSDLKRVLENGIMNESIGWVQFYGLKVYYDKDAKQGDRITSMRLLDGTKIDMDQYYSIVTNDFMYDKGDNYDFTGAIDVVDTGEPIREAMIKIMKEMKNISFTAEETLIAGVDPVVDTDSNSGTTEKSEGNLPKTGSVVGVNQLLTMGSIIAILGAALFLDEKYRNKKKNAA